MTVALPRASWVVVPARDEAPHIAATLAAIARAAAAAPGPVHLVAVDDASADTTPHLIDAAIARWDRGSAVRLAGPATGSGGARRTGLNHALDHAVPGYLIASTDADSVVPADWLAALARRLDAGADVVAGDVALESAADPRLVAARAERLAERLHAVHRTDPTAAHPHFAGANLGFRASALADLRPLPAPEALEDDALHERCRTVGLRIVRHASAPVTTSARLDGRAKVGLAAALSADAALLGLT